MLIVQNVSQFFPMVTYLMFNTKKNGFWPLYQVCLLYNSILVVAIVTSRAGLESENSTRIYRERNINSYC